MLQQPGPVVDGRYLRTIVFGAALLVGVGGCLGSRPRSPDGAISVDLGSGRDRAVPPDGGAADGGGVGPDVRTDGPQGGVDGATDLTSDGQSDGGVVGPVDAGPG